MSIENNNNNNSEGEVKKFIEEYFDSNLNNFILQKYIKDINEGWFFFMTIEKNFKTNCFSSLPKSYYDKYFIVYSIYDLFILNVVLLIIINCGIAIYYYFHPIEFTFNFLNFEILCFCIIISLITPVQKFINHHFTSKIIKQEKIPITFDDLYLSILNNKWIEPKHEKIKI